MSSADHVSRERPQGFTPWKCFGKAEAGRDFLVSKKVFGDLVALVDLLVIVGTAICAKWVYIGTVLETPVEVEPYAVVGLFFSFVALLFLRRQSAHDFEVLRSIRGQSSRILFALFMTALLMVALGYLLKISESYSRGWFLTWMAMASLGVIGVHILAAGLLRHWISRGRFMRRVAVFGDPTTAMQLIPRLEDEDDAVAVIGIFDDNMAGSSGECGSSGSLSDLISLAQTMPLDEVLIVMPMSSGKRITSVVKQLSILPVDWET